MVEEAVIIPRIKPRFYSVINYPFVNGENKANELEFLFSLERFTKNGETKTGVCSQFLT